MATSELRRTALAAGLALLFCPLAPSLAQDPVQDRHPELVLVDDAGAELLRDDWLHFGDGFHLVLFADWREKGKYQLDDVEMNGRLSELRSLEPGFLEVIEVYVVPDDQATGVFDMGEHHRRFEVHFEPNRLTVERWMPSWRGQLTLVAPAGYEYADWLPSMSGSWVAIGNQVRTALEEFRGPILADLWNEILACRTSWRLAMEKVGRWRRVAKAEAVERRLEPLLETKPKDPRVEEVQVQIGALLMLASQSTDDLSRKMIQAVRRSRLCRSSPLVSAAANFYRASRADDVEDRDEALAELLPKRAGDAAEGVLAARRLRIKSGAFARMLVERLAETRGKDWELRSQALRWFGELREPGISLPGDALDPDMAVPEVPFLEEEERWEVRLAWAEALSSFASRVAVERLARSLATEGHARVVDTTLESLYLLTGKRFGVRPDKWIEWLGGRPADWRPIRPAPLPWMPARRVVPLHFTSSESSNFFKTDLSRVVFVIDVSQSMRDGFADEVQRNLERQLDLFEADAEIGLMLFSDRIVHRGTKPSLRAATSKVKDDMVRFFEAYTKEGKTDLEQALRAAFDYEGVEEVFFVTDGFPTEGARREYDELVELVDRLNGMRRVRVNTLLLKEGRAYFEEELKGKDLPVPTAKEREAWAAESGELEQRPDLGLLHALAVFHDGRCRIAFANQIYSRTGAASEDQ